jgi:hypothetical protein
VTGAAFNACDTEGLHRVAETLLACKGASSRNRSLVCRRRNAYFATGLGADFAAHSATVEH